MNRGILVLAAVCLGIACSVQPHANEDLREKLRNHEVRKIEVLRIPDDVAVPVRVTPEGIADRYHAKLELRASSLLPELDGLGRALASTDCKPSKNEVDVRTAIIFFDNDDRKLRAFYYGVGGKNGQVDATPCELGDGLFTWARKRLPQTP